MKDVGMVANEAELEKYARAEGFEPIAMTEAMEVFDTVYDSKAAQRGIMKIVPAQMASYYSVLARTNYFKGLLEVTQDEQTSEDSFIVSYRTLNDTKQKLQALENIVMLQVARIIKMSTSRINNTMTFKGVGVDSLMAIQLRNLLEKSLEIKLPVTMFWKHPSIREYALFLYDSLDVSPEEKLTADLAAIDVKEKSVNWFITPRPNRNAAVRLFCFHDAGGSTSLFHNWENLLGTSVELILVELPGRDRQVALEPITDLAPVIHHLMSTIEFAFDKPFLFLGHSMGGVVAFELARALRQGDKPLPAKLFVSSTPQLRAYDRSLVDYTLSDEELAAIFPHVSAAVIPDAELRQMLMNILRADLKLLSHYQYREAAALPLSIVALHGENDPKVSKGDMEPWASESTELLTLVTRPGGHRYLEHDAEFVTALILQQLQESKRVLSTVTV
jgi:surfactin synthase thioesterase subunit/acyl carrier protein